jgi:hypothetical protein
MGSVGWKVEAAFSSLFVLMMVSVLTVHYCLLRLCNVVWHVV